MAYPFPSKLLTMLDLRANAQKHWKTSERIIVISMSRQTQHHHSSFRISYAQPKIKKTEITDIITLIIEPPTKLNTLQKSFFT
jgi:hypothetical protein